uniref:Aldehyde dehydrogenase domain-containing protein n=1 Tax=Globodera rostochiensis TaxID=31243 RepID=A0A914I7H5_GLORO
MIPNSELFKLSVDISAGLHFFKVIEPGTGAIVAQCPNADDALVDIVVNQAEKVQPSWAAMSPLERSKVLLRAATLIRANLETIASWETRTNGKPIVEARVDIESSADTFAFYGGILPAEFKGDFYDLPTDGQGNRFAYTRREPFGVVGCIGAWNYPFQTCCWKVAPALAAGNAVVYKPSPFAPGSPVLLGELLKAAGLPDGVFNVVQGEAETGQLICLHEKIARVSFTGSVSTGRKIQQTCALRGIKPVTLELGGKSAFIVFEDANLQDAVASAILANFCNQGEVCTNATRVFVQQSVLNSFQTKLLTELGSKMRVGNPLEDSTNVGATINEQHLEKVIQLVEHSKKQGFYFEPAVLTNLDDDMEIVKEEIFGAVMLILPFQTEEEAVSRANATQFGLASGLCTTSLARAHRVAAQLKVGTVFVNTYNDAEVHIPFGGFKNSGHGRENCVECLHEYSQVKAVYMHIGEGLQHNLG